jgi:plastocyanin
MHKRLGLLAVGVVAAASVAAPSVALAHTKIVYPGGPVAFQNSMAHKTGAGVNAFLQSKVTINAGDAVVWDGPANAAGFHNVDLPGPSTHDLPVFVPDPSHPVSGVNDAAASPFWFNGVPSLGFNPALLVPSGGHVYDGSTRIDSGVPFGPPKPFKVTFTKPGVYRYFCDIHYGMAGTVVVLAKGKKVPSASQDAAALKQQEQNDLAIAKRVDKTKVTGAKVLLGATGANGVEVYAMFPATLHVPVGTVVTFSMSAKTRDVHTATFGDTSKNGYVTKLGNTAFRGATVDPRGGYPSDPPGAGPIQLSLTLHGNGFANTGVLDQDAATPQIPPSGQIKFTQAGTYHYICLIHPFMKGTVIVK